MFWHVNWALLCAIEENTKPHTDVAIKDTYGREINSREISRPQAGVTCLRPACLPFLGLAETEQEVLISQSFQQESSILFQYDSRTLGMHPKFQ